MFSSEIVRSDMFLDLPISSQLLYFHFGMIADDDGIVANVRRELSYLGFGSVDDLKILNEKKLIEFTEDGKVLFIIDWLKNNVLRADRYSETTHINAKNELIEKGYKFKKTKRLPTGIPNDNQPAPPELVKGLGLDIGLDKGLGLVTETTNSQSQNSNNHIGAFQYIESVTSRSFSAIAKDELLELINDFGNEAIVQKIENRNQDDKFNGSSPIGVIRYIRKALTEDEKDKAKQAESDKKYNELFGDNVGEVSDDWMK
jgi:hypothetical protein